MPAGLFTVTGPGRIDVGVPPVAPGTRAPFEVETAAGTATSEAFLVTADVRVESMTPRTGPPGTVVTVRGRDLDWAGPLGRDGAVLEDQMLEDGTTLHFVIPPGLASGAFGFHAGGDGAGVATPVFTVTPPEGHRPSFLATPLAPVRVVPGNMPLLDPWNPGFHLLDVPAGMRTSQYGALHFPKIPIFHDYNPLLDNLRPGKSTGTFCTLALGLPRVFLEAVPAALRDRVRALGIPEDRVDLFCVSQDMPYLDDAGYLFRPHYWTDPEAPGFVAAPAAYNRGRTVEVGLFDAGPAFHFQGHAAGDFFPGPVHVHDDGFFVLSSPGGVMNLVGLDHGTTTAFWTLVRLEDRAAATLHLFLNDADQALLDAVAGAGPATLGQVFEAAAGPWDNAAGRKLRALVRPRVDRALVGPAAWGFRTVFLAGSGFTDAAAVTLDGMPARGFRVVADHLIVATVAEAGGGPRAFTVATPLGGEVSGLIPSGHGIAGGGEAALLE
ncbi:hypothetical protein [Mesoterricola silvestris]|uniref:hypothetical protein n=1 Tax=Mesoterricola silvestris TaxID=2927979 RepID=UPI0029312CC0|nr:hypothetical protein [Mesoterricola silvestris]